MWQYKNLIQVLTSWEQLCLPENCAVSEHQLDNVCQLVFFSGKVIFSIQKMITVHNCMLMWAASKALSAGTSSGGRGPHTLIAVLIFLSLSEVPMSGCSDRHISQTQELAHRLQTSPQSAAAGKVSSQGSSSCCSCSCSLPPPPHSLLLLLLLLLFLSSSSSPPPSSPPSFSTGNRRWKPLFCVILFCILLFSLYFPWWGEFEWSVFLSVLSVLSFKHLILCFFAVVVAIATRPESRGWKWVYTSLWHW